MNECEKGEHFPRRVANSCLGRTSKVTSNNDDTDDNDHVTTHVHMSFVLCPKTFFLSQFYRVAYYWSDPERWLGSAGVGRLVDILAAQHVAL